MSQAYACRGPFSKVCPHGWNTPHTLTREEMQYSAHLFACGLLPAGQVVEMLPAYAAAYTRGQADYAACKCAFYLTRKGVVKWNMRGEFLVGAIASEDRAAYQHGYADAHKKDTASLLDKVIARRGSLVPIFCESMGAKPMGEPLKGKV